MKVWPRTNAPALGIAALAVALSFVAAPVAAQQWATKMFDKTSHNFGVVARGAKAECRFTVENIYLEDAHVLSVSSSCHCSSPRIVGQQVLKTWQKTEIAVSLDTRAEPGRKDGTITVIFDLPFHAEVQLHVYSDIRGDVVVQPGAAEFGSINQGNSAEKKLTISYAGRADWKIERVECANPNIVAAVTETNRGNGLVGYSLSIQLKGTAPAGYLNDQVVLVTNDFDTKKSRVPVSVEGVVVAPLTVRPSPLTLVLPAADKSQTGNLVVQGHTTFHIVSVRSSDPRFQCKAATTADTPAKTFYVLPVTFVPDNSPPPASRIRAKITIETDLPGKKTIEASVEAAVAEKKN